MWIEFHSVCCIGGMQQYTETGQTDTPATGHSGWEMASALDQCPFLRLVDFTDQRVCGQPSSHCPDCGQPTPSLCAAYCSIICRPDTWGPEVGATRAPNREISPRLTGIEPAEREPDRSDPPELSYRRRERHGGRIATDFTTSGRCVLDWVARYELCSDIVIQSMTSCSLHARVRSA